MASEGFDFDDFLGGSHFPHRPDHPDFWRLSQIVLRMDGMMEAARDDDEKRKLFEAELGKHINHETLYYLAFQRAIRGLGLSTAGEVMANLEPVQHMIQMFIDAFIIGCNFKDEGGKQ